MTSIHNRPIHDQRYLMLLMNKPEAFMSFSFRELSISIMIFEYLREYLF
jgi:hypothetical protein